ncbi:MAG: flavin monoamine oxidase family protein [Cyanobium sp.]|jgi:monoamine oxidase
MAEPTAVDVVVVGAGLSGLICARELRRQGLRLRLLEARQRWGGRMLAQTVAPGQSLELGGQWVGASHRRLISLLEEQGLQRYPSFDDGAGVFHWNGRARPAPLLADFRSSLLFFEPSALELPPAELEQALAVQRRFAELVDRVPPRAPWSLDDSAALDRLSIAAWLEQQGACDLAGYPLAWLARMGGSGGFEPYESSILHLAWTQAVAPQHETPEAWLVTGGISQLAAGLAAELEEELQLGCPVAAIEQQGGRVRLRSDGGEELVAAAAVVAVPPPLRLGIRFSPPLAPALLALLQRSPMGAMVKVVALYRQPFWREQGLCGLGIGTLPFLELTVDSSAPDGPGLLVGFIAAERAVRWRGLAAAEQRRAVLRDLASLWGPRAAEPEQLLLHDWTAEPWSGGAFTSFFGAGAWSRYGAAWWQPHGRVVWAGTEVASRWPGYFEGAIEAGLSAAGQVRELLG